MNKICSDSKGFTLLESMIALAVLAVGLLGLAQLFVVAIMQNTYGRTNTMAVSVATDKLESLHNNFNNDLVLGVPSADMTAGDHGPSTVTIVPPSNSNQGTYNYNVAWTVTFVNGNERDVTVTVSPPKSSIKFNRVITLTTHFTP